jgi:hypothetical protein
MAELTIPKRATAFSTYVSLTSQANTKIKQVAPTLAIGDVTVSKDGGGFVNITTLPVVTPAAGVAVLVSLSATEMTADSVFVRFCDASGAEWCDLTFELRPTAETLTANFAAIPAAVWAAGTRTLSSFGTLVADVWAYATRVLTDYSGVWTATTRTLTQTGATITSAVSGSTLTVVRHVTFSGTISGLTIPATWSKMYLTAKLNNEADNVSQLQIVETATPAITDGLLYIAGGALPTGIVVGDASLTVSQSGGTVAIVIDDEATAEMLVNLLSYDIKCLLQDGSSQQLTAGTMLVTDTVTETIA